MNLFGVMDVSASALKAERVRAGLLTPAEARTAEHLATPISMHFDAYL